MLIPISAWGIYVFSFYGALGATISIFGTIDNLPLGPNLYRIFFGIIGLILVVPIILLVWKNKQIWRQIMFKSLSFLLIYLSIGIGVVFAFLFGLNLNPPFLNKPQSFQVACQMVSLFLAIGYYFFFKKVIKPYSLKV